jgi:hypothetical protein
VSAWGDIPAGYTSVPCPRGCGDDIYGTPENIDSGLRKHLDNYCPVDPDETEE